MPFKCIVCGKTRREVVSLFRFPISNRNLSRQWQRKLGLRDSDVKASSRVCSDHFPPDSWDGDVKASMLRTASYRRLRPGALPLKVHKRTCISKTRTFSEVTAVIVTGNSFHFRLFSYVRHQNRHPRSQVQIKQCVAWTAKCSLTMTMTFP